ncbi:MAG: type II toxin-antitoxin system RelE/ParE family toxin [Pseudomonadota bacterium]|nr:type II toxin-antitoxin system RelE/ParE family toxin [Pseudomonadota bacterium]
MSITQIWGKKTFSDRLLVWAREALNKLNEIEEFIATNNPERAESFIDYLISQGESIVLNPQIGRSIPEISDPEIREIIAKKYRIVYKVTHEQIEILTVFEGHKLLRIDELIIDL